MTKLKLHDRFLRPRVLEALGDSPVVLIHGPRQCGKTTLVQEIGDQEGYDYITFDDDVQKAAAEADPVGYVSDLSERVILDEVQRVPKIFTSLKAVVDKKRKPGRFILTGSANVLLVPNLADSLAGRMEILRLHPLSQDELAESRSNFLETIFGSESIRRKDGKRLGAALAAKVAAGGYPSALSRSTAARSRAWYRGYAETLIQRDIRDLAKIRSIGSLPKLLEMAASRTAKLTNFSDLAGPFEISRKTIREYVTLLSQIFLLEELPPWFSNRMKRLVKTPKLHMGDTGLACSLLGLDARSLWEDRSLYGHMLETFLYQELRKQGSAADRSVSFYHFRDKDQDEVDVVLESEGKISGVEVKGAATVGVGDFKGLKKLQAATGKKFTRGFLLYDGEAVVPFGPGLYAVPISTLWKGF